MKEDWLDKNLGEQLDGYDSPMDLENAWESLQAKRQVPKKKNKFFFLWIFFGMLAIGSAGSYFLYNNASVNPLTDAKNGVRIQSMVSEKIKTDSPTLSPSEKTNSDNATANTLKNKEEKSLTTTNRNYENLGLATKNKSYENQNYSDQQKIKTNVESTTSSSKNGNNNLNSSNTNFDFPRKSNVDLIFPIQHEAENMTMIDSSFAQKEVQPIAVSFLPDLETSLLELSSEENVELSGDLFSGLNTPIITKSFPTTPNYFGIAAGFGIRSKGKIMSQENPLDVISVNTLFEKRFTNSKIYFKTGITFDQFVNSIESTTEQSLSQQANNQLIAVNHFQNGTTQDVFGTAKVQVIEKTTSKNFNRYRLISIPLIVGYDLISSKKASIQIEGGAARSIFGFHSGKDFDSVDADFEKRGVWQGLYGLNFNWGIGRKAHLFTSVKGNYHLNKIGKSDQLDIEKFRFHQIQLGLRFKL